MKIFLSSSTRFSQCLALYCHNSWGMETTFPGLLWTPLVKPSRDQPGHPLWPRPGCQGGLKSSQKTLLPQCHCKSTLFLLHILSIYLTTVSVSKGMWRLDKRNWVTCLLGVVKVNLYMGESTLGKYFLRKRWKLQLVFSSHRMRVAFWNAIGRGIWETYCSNLFI